MLVLALAGALLVATGAGSWERARAAFPGRDGVIGFERGVHPGVAIFTMRPDGSGVRRLTPRHRVSEWPAFSSGGHRIAFARQNPRSFEHIWVMRADGSGAHHVTGTPHQAFDPAFSPSGRRIAFAGADTGDDLEIFTIRVNGTHLRQVTHNRVEDSEPVFSPRGGRIAFARSSPGIFGQIYTIRPDGSRPHRVTHSPDHVSNQFPDFSPDGGRIAFDRRSFRRKPNGIFTIGVRGGGERQLTNPPIDTTQDLEPAFSPSGRRIVFVRSRNGRDRIFSMRSDGSHPRRLSDGDDLVPTWQPITR